MYDLIRGDFLLQGSGKRMSTKEKRICEVFGKQSSCSGEPEQNID